MIMPVTVMDKLQFNEKKGAFIEKIIDTDFLTSALFFKYLIHSLKNTEPMIRDWDEVIFEDKDLFTRHFLMLIDHMESEVNSKEKNKITEIYTTSDLAKFIGVSQQTINKWINLGRIKGVNREGREHARIPDDAEVIYPNGVRILVSELKENWEKENEEPVTDEITYLRYCIDEFRKQYGGPFEETLGKKTLLELTSDEETDASVWKSYLKRLNDAEANYPDS
ncbi:DNA-binding protein [Brevibacillus nitrificans]|uniref:DNA-binding protein n=1 Tax=Brevibacillus nitrificans TaxID=651560 RepID=A0A3M8D6E0_9BACL|nr:helix-turn-helix domain-containing protein [Brevibacillus nitrificans]RNB83007.1 DNA-binding protein [Brevibacillus nitrificans]